MTSDEQHLICPGCGEPAVPQPPADLVPRQAHGLAVPEWSHRDRSSLCPVIGPAGYEPAQPQPAGDQAGTKVPRLVPPDADRQPGRDDPGRQAGTGGAVSRPYMNRAMARLGEMHRQDQAEPEPEAGS